MRECPNLTLALELGERWLLAHTLARGEAKAQLHLNLERDRWLSVHSTVGVLSLFTCNNRPIPDPPGVLIACTNGSDITRLDVDLILGQPVRIVSGPFANVVGSLTRLNANGRVQALLDIMGGSVPITAQRSVLSPAA